jgi:hypothetical protein
LHDGDQLSFLERSLPKYGEWWAVVGVEVEVVEMKVVGIQVVEVEVEVEAEVEVEGVVGVWKENVKEKRMGKRKGKIEVTFWQEVRYVDVK